MTFREMLELYDEINKFDKWGQKEPTFRKIRKLANEHRLKGTADVCVWLRNELNGNPEAVWDTLITEGEEDVSPPKKAAPIERPFAAFTAKPATPIADAVATPSKPPPPQRSLVNHPVKPNTIGVVLSVLWRKRYQFPGAIDPIQMKSFCDPINGHWDKTQDQLTEKQKKLYISMIINYEKDCRDKGITPEYYDE